MENKHERKQQRKAMALAELRLRECKNADRGDIFHQVTFIKRRTLSAQEHSGYLFAEHVKHCVYGAECNGSCNDYGCP